MNFWRGPFGAFVVSAFLLSFVYPLAGANPDNNRRQRRPLSLPPSSVELSPRSSTQSPLDPWVKLVSSFGVILDANLAANPNAPLIIHLQDVHAVEEAQRNLASLVSAFHEKGGIGLVGLEGSGGAFNQAEYRDSPFPTLTQSVANSLFEYCYLT